MTAARQERKRYRAPPRPSVAILAGILLAVVGHGSRTVAATTERIVVDWHSGLAIGGYDPVAFFTDGTPRQGSADFEYRYGGAVWRFCNTGNRDAFVANPDIYMPQFGGYDPIGVVRGIALAGNPDVWIIAGERLFLFYDQARRDKFAKAPDRLFVLAQQRWPEVVATLSR
jgi:YHS domain-containing protein